MDRRLPEEENLNLERRPLSDIRKGKALKSSSMERRFQQALFEEKTFKKLGGRPSKGFANRKVF